MDKIYTVMVIEKFEKSEYGYLDLGSKRMVGWFQDYKNALENVTYNSCDINERYYEYALIEEIEEGLYKPALKASRHWFKFSREKEEYVPINEPEFCNHYAGFTIG